MSIAYPLRIFFDCSTAHLSGESRAYLEEIAGRLPGQVEPWAASTPYGWFLYADETCDPSVPADLAQVMRHARGLGADYILLDADAEICPALPIFEW